jgi:hypothetical protein
MANDAFNSKIFETSAGTWKVRWRARNKNQQKTFRRRADALKFQAELFSGKPVPAKLKNISVEDFAAVWVKRY